MASERRYQLEVLEKASKENIILYQETRGGKTLIAVLLVKSLAHNLRLKGDKRIVVFLAHCYSCSPGETFRHKQCVPYYLRINLSRS